MRLNQGGALTLVINVEDGNGGYIADLSSYVTEVSLLDSNGRRVGAWSTEKGTITVGSTVVAGVTIGYFEIQLDGTQTRNYLDGQYSLEISRVLGDSRAIGKCHGFLDVDVADLRAGI